MQKDSAIKNITVSLPPKTHEQLTALADKEHRSVKAQVLHLIEQAIRTNNEQGKEQSNG